MGEKQEKRSYDTGQVYSFGPEGQNKPLAKICWPQKSTARSLLLVTTSVYTLLLSTASDCYQCFLCLYKRSLSFFAGYSLWTCLKEQKPSQLFGYFIIFHLSRLVYDPATRCLLLCLFSMQISPGIVVAVLRNSRHRVRNNYYYFIFFFADIKRHART